MLKYQDILPDLKQGKYIILTRKKNDFLIISPFKDEYGNYRDSNWNDNLEYIKKRIGISFGYSEKCFNEDSEKNNWQFAGFFVPDFEVPKIGDKMYVLPECERELRKTLRWNEGIREIIGKKIEITDLSGECAAVDNEYDIPYTCLSYLPPQSEKPNLTGKEVEVEVEGKVYKAKIIG